MGFHVSNCLWINLYISDHSTFPLKLKHNFEINPLKIRQTIRKIIFENLDYIIMRTWEMRVIKGRFPKRNPMKMPWMVYYTYRQARPPMKIRSKVLIRSHWF